MRLSHEIYLTGLCASTVSTGEDRPNSDIVARGVRIRAQGVRHLHWHVRLGARQPRQADPELDFNAESARRRPHCDTGIDLGSAGTAMPSRDATNLTIPRKKEA